jgi:hypothetical protein
VIQATEADIGRRVLYDMRPIEKRRVPGKLVGVEGRFALVLFKDHNTPLRVFSNLFWDDRGRA